MNQENTKYLLERYSKIFRQSKLDATQTCMCWGFDCGDGWFTILNCLCGTLQSYIDRHAVTQIEAIQVKEKFGTLRFYVQGGDEITDSIIEYAEILSSQTCEHCGSTEGVKQTKGYVVTLCRKCMKEHKRRLEL